MAKKVKVGVIGCGNISDAYFKASQTFKNLQFTACADQCRQAAEAKAAIYGLRVLSVEELLADKSIEIVLNLTTPQAHTAINLLALKAGKHTYCEKPFGLDRKSGQQVLQFAEKNQLYTGCAPDTFLGGSHQTCRQLIDNGAIGTPLSGTAFMMCHGHESWHPAPAFYYLKGGGPLFDMGPYYITALVNMLGPVKKVTAINTKGFKTRVATSEKAKGQRMKVEVNTHIAGLLEFVSGAVITLVTSFDVWKHTNHNIEIHGSEGSMRVPDPNCFGGKISIFKSGMPDWEEVVPTFGYLDNMRSIGLADMAESITRQIPCRCSGELAFHVLDVMCALEEASAAGKHIKIKSNCTRPTALPTGLSHGKLFIK
jgi:predicted dehydrogenase